MKIDGCKRSVVLELVLSWSRCCRVRRPVARSATVTHAFCQLLPSSRAAKTNAALSKTWPNLNHVPHFPNYHTNCQTLSRMFEIELRKHFESQGVAQRSRTPSNESLHIQNPWVHDASFARRLLFHRLGGYPGTSRASRRYLTALASSAYSTFGEVASEAIAYERRDQSN